MCAASASFSGSAGRMRGPASITHDKLRETARAAIKDIGYEQEGFHWKTADIECYVHSQSADIAQGVDAAGNKDEGAGDQGIMFGYACRETEHLMPAPIYYAHRILKLMSEARRSGKEKGLGPDAKSQVTLRYENGKPVGCTKVVVSTQHNEKNRNGKKYTPGMVKDLIGDAVASALPKGWMPQKAADFLVNPTGNFVIGGPVGDCGLTGRKIIVDTYGGMARHGGGAFSGKDPSKVDRSAAYAARYVAKNVVAAGLAERCEVQVAYAIGVAHPVSLMVETFGTGVLPDARISQLVEAEFDMRPGAFRRYLDLHRPIFQKTAAYGHFGRDDPDFTWERTDRVDALRTAAGLAAAPA